MDEPDFIEVIPLGEEPEVNAVLEGASNAGLEYVLLIGQAEDGGWYFAASSGDAHRAVFSADQFKQFMLNHAS
jgi:hypothetical protein